jgi:hypothetical protein
VGERGERGDGKPHYFKLKKCYNSQTKKTKLNFVYTIKFVSINHSKQDVTWIYLDNMTSGLHSGCRMI